MTTIDSSPGTATAPGDSDPAGQPATADHDPLRSVGGWLMATDHKRIGRLYLGGGVLGLLAVLTVNILLNVERVDGGDRALDADTWAQLLDAQRVGLIFGAILPLSLGLAVAVVPLQLGARALAFPRLAGFGLWSWLGGLILVVIALANDGGTSGGDSDMVDLFIAAHALMAIGLAATAGSLATTILSTRAPGMTIRRVPFFSWSVLVYTLGLLLVLPVLLGTLVYLFVDHRNPRTGFGGNEGIVRWVGWIFTQPTSFLLAVPAVGVFVELLPVTFRRRTPARGVFFGGLALVAFAAFAAVTQQNIFDLPWAGSGLNLEDFGSKFDDLVPYLLFNGLPVLGMVLLLALGLFVARPQRGVRPMISAGFLLAFFGFGMVLTGMLGNALYAIDDLALRGTVFEEAVLVYVVYGAVLGLLGGIAHWAPKLWGVTLPTGRVVAVAALGFVATVLASLPHYVAGFLDQPAGLIYDDSDLQVWNIVVLVGHALMVLAVLGFVGLGVLAVRGRAGAADDPWDGHTVEWATTSPAPADNYVDVPIVHSAEPNLDLKTPAGVGSDA